MTTLPHEPIAHGERFTSAARGLSFTLLALAVAVMMGSGFPSAEVLQTKPGQFGTFALMLFGLTVAERWSLQGAAITLAGWLGYLALEHASTSAFARATLVAFPLAATLHLLAWWRERRPRVPAHR